MKKLEKMLWLARIMPLKLKGKVYRTVVRQVMIYGSCLQFVVGSDGAVGITYEHCAAEGPPVIAIVDHAFSYWSVPTTSSF